MRILDFTSAAVMSLYWFKPRNILPAKRGGGVPGSQLHQRWGLLRRLVVQCPACVTGLACLLGSYTSKFACPLHSLPQSP